MSPSVPTHTVLLLPSASHAVKGEAALTRAGVPCVLIPVPRTLSSQCGVCLRVSLADRERAAEVLAEAGLEVSGVHDLEMRRPRTEAVDEHATSEH
jgi:hypothetical protein